MLGGMAQAIEMLEEGCCVAVGGVISVHLVCSFCVCNGTTKAKQKRSTENAEYWEHLQYDGVVPHAAHINLPVWHIYFLVRHIDIRLLLFSKPK